MKVSLSAAILLFAVFCSGCTGDGDSNANVSNTAADAANTAAAPSEITDANAALAEGIRLLDVNQTEQAVEVLKRATELDPDLAEAYFRLGIAYSLIEAENESNAVVEETPTPDPKQKKPKEIKSASDKAFEQAVKAYKKHLEKNPDDDAAYYNMGRAYNKLNEDEDAARALREAVKLKPEDTEYQTELGAIYIKLAKYHEAVSALRKAVDLDSENIEAQELLDKAEAGKRRIDFAAPKKDDKRSERDTKENFDEEAGEEKSEEDVKPSASEKKPAADSKKNTPPANKQ